MGTIIGLIAILLLIVYPPYMLIKWAIYGKGLFFPDFKRLTEKLNEKSNGFSVDLTGWYGKVSYYFLFLWVSGEIALIVIILK
jgi:hypothetical protein